MSAPRPYETDSFHPLSWVHEVTMSLGLVLAPSARHVLSLV